MYSTYWQKLQTGRMLLGIPLPNIKTNANVEVIYEPPPPKERIYEARLAALRTIPSRNIALQANSMLGMKRINNIVFICLCIIFWIELFDNPPSHFFLVYNSVLTLVILFL